MTGSVRSAITSTIDPAEALAIAAASQPDATGCLARDAALLGQQVALAATDYGRDPIVGTLAGSTQFSL